MREPAGNQFVELVRRFVRGMPGSAGKVARMGFTAVELPMTQPQVPSALADEIRNTGLAVSLCAALGPGRDLSSFDSAVRHPQWII